MQMKKEMLGTLRVFGISVLTGLYSSKYEDVKVWQSRIPKMMQWACRIEWHMTWTTKGEYRDSIGEIINMDQERDLRDESNPQPTR